MAQIKINWPAPPVDGAEVKFKAPCDCTAVNGLLISYPAADGTEGTQVFTFRDSLVVDLTGIGPLFKAGAYVKVMLDTVNGYAYIQNAATNAYLESKTKGVTVEIPAAAWSGNTQTVSVAGITENSNVVVTPHPDSYIMWAECMVRATEQGAGSLTFACEDAPGDTIKANLLIVG